MRPPFCKMAAPRDKTAGRTPGRRGYIVMYPAWKTAAEPQRQNRCGSAVKNALCEHGLMMLAIGTNLAPADPNGKSDPYVVVKVGEQMMDSQERYIPKQLNPVFGEVFELTISFPVESELTISVFDHDLIGSDDLIGETKLDLENRFYSNHRPNCGLALQYDTEGYNEWRDAFKPSQILSSLCKKHSLPAPEYRREEIKVNNKIFKVPNEAFPEAKTSPTFNNVRLHNENNEQKKSYLAEKSSNR
ncbi:unnamed protein product [Ranitomeya imitator]|uniref:C2 domain-containing protein n=1 Tax=Ranitomeya imitator TaxID=111125 RepID=A0ABN9L477_9NEOB|nr:unnamed protein product [Ranitomeya imitator]